MHCLTDAHLRFVAQRLPRDIRQLLTEHPRKLYVGGGFIRAVIAGEEPSDIDIFGSDVDLVAAAADILVSRRGDGTKKSKTKNAITVLTPNRLPIQFITRWTFDHAEDLVKSFDFTVCQAAIWRTGNQSNSAWRSSIGGDFYVDLASKNLVYTSPVRIEEAGGSLLRVIKYVRRGYSIQVTSLGAVVARLTGSLDESFLTSDEISRGLVIAGLLLEVDPLLVVDGFDMVDDHEEEPIVTELVSA